MQRMLVPAILFAVLGSAYAEPDYEAAAKHYTNAESARSAGDYDTAVKEFLAAYEVTKDPTIYKQVARSHELAKHRKEAATYYKRYLAEAEVKPEERATVEDKIRELEKPDTGVIEPGDGTEEPGPPPSFADGSPRWQKTAAWVSVGVAAVFLATGGVLGMSAMARQDEVQRLVEFRDMDNLPKQYSGVVQADYEDKVSEGEKLETYSRIAFIGAGTAAAAATLFFVLNATAGGPRESKVGVSFGPDGAGVSARWEF